MGPELNWPNATLRLSALYYYGTPLLHGVRTPAMVGLVSVGALSLSLGAARYAHKDIGT